MVILKDFVPAALLRVVMLRHRSPPHDRFFIAPCRVRQDPARPTTALEALVVDEPVYSLKYRPQALREIEVEVELLPLGMDFEDN
jgi:hypothetical protein